MIKQIRRWGNNLVITFTTKEEEIYGLKDGDKIVLDDMLIQEVKKDAKQGKIAK